MNKYQDPNRSGLVIVEPHLVGSRLRKLHPTLNQDRLIAPLLSGKAQKNNCTDHHGKSYPGMVLHFEGMCSFRDIFVPLGWTPESTSNFESTLSPDRRISIALAGGDEHTGNPDRTPSTRNDRGPITCRMVRRNAQPNLSFDDAAEEERLRIFADDSETAHVDETVETWLLMHNDHGEFLSCELSLPIKTDDSGKIIRWSERLILGHLPLDEDEREFPVDEPVDPVVEVRRRAN